MRKVIVGTIMEKIKTLLVIEVFEKLKFIKIDERKDRIRVIFEFEFKNGEIHDAVEVRWRRPWE